MESNEKSPNEHDLYKFYQQAFWWMMGLGATGLMAAVGLSISMKINLSQLTTEMVFAKAEQLKLHSAIIDTNKDIRTMILEIQKEKYPAVTAIQDKVLIEGRILQLDLSIKELTKEFNQFKLETAKKEAR